MQGPSYSAVANGNISPSRFVKLDTTAKGKVVQATDGSSSHGDPTWGISQAGTRNIPNTNIFNDDGYAAIAGENIGVYGPPDVGVMLELGGSVTIGDYLKSDANGKGITSSTDADFIGARALDTGVSGDLIRVQVLPPIMHA